MRKKIIAWALNKITLDDLFFVVKKVMKRDMVKVWEFSDSDIEGEVYWIKRTRH